MKQIRQCHISDIKANLRRVIVTIVYEYNGRSYVYKRRSRKQFVLLPSNEHARPLADDSHL